MDVFGRVASCSQRPHGLAEIGFEKARRDGVNPHAARRPFQRQRPGHVHQRALGRHIGQMGEQIIADHHNPAAFNLEAPLLLYLDVANNLCKKLGIGFVDFPELDMSALVSNQLLGIDDTMLDEVAGKLQHTLETEMEIFI